MPQVPKGIASAFRERPGQQVVYAEDRRVGPEVVSIQLRSLGPDDRQDIAPLPVRHSTAASKPSELLKQNVLRRVHEQRAIADLHWSPAGELLRVERGAARHEHVHFILRRMMNQIGTALCPNRTT